MWVRFPPGTRLSNSAPLRLTGNARTSGLRLICFLPKAHPCGLRLCRSTPVGSIPAGNVSDLRFVFRSSVEVITSCEWREAELRRRKQVEHLVVSVI